MKWSGDLYLLYASDTRVSEFANACITKVAQLISELLPDMIEALNGKP